MSLKETPLKNWMLFSWWERSLQNWSTCWKINEVEQEKRNQWILLGHAMMHNTCSRPLVWGLDRPDSACSEGALLSHRITDKAAPYSVSPLMSPTTAFTLMTFPNKSTLFQGPTWKYQWPNSCWAGQEMKWNAAPIALKSQCIMTTCLLATLFWQFCCSIIRPLIVGLNFLDSTS